MDDLPKPVKLLYFITELNIGGAEKVLVHILKHLDRSRFDPAVVSLYGGDGPIADEIRALDVPVTDLGMSAKWRLDALWRLYRLLRRERPAILHTSLFHANTLGRIVGRLARVPIIVTWRQNVDIGGRVRELINRWTTRLDDRVVAVSRLVRDAEVERARVSPDKVTIIYNCVDTDVYTARGPRAAAQVRKNLGIAPDTLLVGTVGRLHPQKGIADLITAMMQMKLLVPNARLLLVGEGQLRDGLEILAESLCVSDVVVFAGARTDVPQILSALDLFVLPSLWEGLPLALLEAASVGLPVVATAVGGTPEVVMDGVTGLLVPPRDPDALAEAILTLLHDPDLRQRMGQAGQERVREHFSVEQMVKETEGLYQRLLAEKGLA
jgi:sugar transferase (PEP-CTERM/EpsH1 system associated)